MLRFALWRIRLALDGCELLMTLVLFGCDLCMRVC